MCHDSDCTRYAQPCRHAHLCVFLDALANYCTPKLRLYQVCKHMQTSGWATIKYTALSIHPCVFRRGKRQVRHRQVHMLAILHMCMCIGECNKHRVCIVCLCVHRTVYSTRSQGSAKPTGTVTSGTHIPCTRLGCPSPHGPVHGPCNGVACSLACHCVALLLCFMAIM